MPLGIIAGVVCNLSTQIKFLLKIDDALDLFAEHAVAGIIGLLWNAFFAADYVIGLDGVNMGASGGFINHHWAPLYKQFTYIVACSAYTFVMTCVICLVLDRIPGLKLRADEDAEMRGMDEDQIGEFAYDYVEVRRDFMAWSAPTHTDGIPIESYRNQPTLNVPSEESQSSSSSSAQIIEKATPSTS